MLLPRALLVLSSLCFAAAGGEPISEGSFTGYDAEERGALLLSRELEGAGSENTPSYNIAHEIPVINDQVRGGIKFTFTQKNLHQDGGNKQLHWSFNVIHKNTCAKGNCESSCVGQICLSPSNPTANSVTVIDNLPTDSQAECALACTNYADPDGKICVGYTYIFTDYRCRGENDILIKLSPNECAAEANAQQEAGCRLFHKKDCIGEGSIRSRMIGNEEKKTVPVLASGLQGMTAWVSDSFDWDTEFFFEQDELNLCCSPEKDGDFNLYTCDFQGVLPFVSTSGGPMDISLGAHFYSSKIQTGKDIKSEVMINTADTADVEENIDWKDDILLGYERGQCNDDNDFEYCDANANSKFCALDSICLCVVLKSSETPPGQLKLSQIYTAKQIGYTAATTDDNEAPVELVLKKYTATLGQGWELSISTPHADTAGIYTTDLKLFEGDNGPWVDSGSRLPADRVLGCFSSTLYELPFCDVDESGNCWNSYSNNLSPSSFKFKIDAEVALTGFAGGDNPNPTRRRLELTAAVNLEDAARPLLLRRETQTADEEEEVQRGDISMEFGEAMVPPLDLSKRVKTSLEFIFSGTVAIDASLDTEAKRYGFEDALRVTLNAVGVRCEFSVNDQTRRERDLAEEESLVRYTAVYDDSSNAAKGLETARKYNHFAKRISEKIEVDPIFVGAKVWVKVSPADIQRTVVVLSSSAADDITPLDSTIDDAIPTVPVATNSYGRDRGENGDEQVQSLLILVLVTLGAVALISLLISVAIIGILHLHRKEMKKIIGSPVVSDSPLRKKVALEET